MKYISSTSLAYVPASHEDPTDPGVLKKVLTTYKDNLSGSIQMVNWAKLLPHKSFARHAHRDMTELFVMMDGEVTTEVDGKIVQLLRGDALVIEPGEQHEMRNNSDAPAHFLAIGIAP